MDVLDKTILFTEIIVFILLIMCFEMYGVNKGAHLMLEQIAENPEKYVELTINQYNYTETVDVQPQVNIIQESTEYDDWKFAQELARRFAENHNYTEDYVCTDYANDFRELALSVGLQATSKCGFPEEGSVGHRWNTITLDIEPQTGMPTNYEYKYNYTSPQW